jgi:hypothetical protein
MLRRICFAVACLAASAVLAADAVRPAITAIHPGTDRLPANHLKFYIHFSQPMQQGVFLRHCALLDQNGKPVVEPFRETELWSADRKRLTLWLHPGRQKTGVNLNDEFGPVLQPARRYTLVISGEWPSDEGSPLGAPVRKHFTAVDRASAQLDVSSWRLTAPSAGTSTPLEVRFPAPLDHALIERSLRVTDSKGAPVAGEGHATNHDHGWRFTPDRPWADTAHQLLADAVLEDLAGNSLARPFEVDLQGPAPKPAPAVITIPFSPVRQNH